jgi:hypothetical protein
MALKASEISELLKQRIKNFESAAEARDVGTVIAVTDGICRIHGLADAKYGEMLEFPKNTFGLALNLEQDSVGAVVLGDYKHISEGDTVKTTGRILEVPVGNALLGRVVNSLGEPIDGKGPINASGRSPIEQVAPGVITRQSVNQPRPPDRQDRRRDRRDHQSEGHWHKVHLRGDRPEERLGRNRGAQARSSRRDGSHHRGGGYRFRVRSDAIHRAVLRLRDG